MVPGYLSTKVNELFEIIFNSHFPVVSGELGGGGNLLLAGKSFTE